MKSVKKIIIVSMLLMAVASFASEFSWSAKNTAMGDGGFSLPLDAASVFYNPAHAGAFGEGVLSLGYGIPVAGFESSTKSLYLAYARPLGWKFGTALIANYESIETYSIMRTGLRFAYRVELAGTLSVAIGGDWIQKSFDLPADDPLRLRGTSASAISGNFGLLWQGANDKLAIGIAAHDIFEPKVAIDDATDAAKLPMRIGAGISYALSPYFTPEVGFDWRSIEYGDMTNPAYHVGFVGGLRNNVLRWRGGISPNMVNIGAGWHTDAVFGGMDIDYSFGLPTAGTLLDAGATQHYFGISISGRKARFRRGDLDIKDLQIEGSLKVGERQKVSATVTNLGKIAYSGIPNALAVSDGVGWDVVIPGQYVDTLAPGQYVRVTWNWTPKKQGKFQIRTATDDDGSCIPEVSGMIAETNEGNNRIMREVYVVSRDTLFIEPKYTTLSATQVITKLEEEPLVPVIFFAPGSAAIDERGTYYIDIFAERLTRNPNAKMVLRGFFHDSDGEDASKELAERRANAVRDAFVAHGAELASRVEIRTNHDAKAFRIKSAYAPNDPRVADENRRVELEAELLGISGTLFEDNAPTFLNSNPDFLLAIIEGRAKTEDAASALDQANTLQHRILESHPDLLERVVAEDKVAPSVKLALELDPDGIVIKPKERYPVSEEWKDPKPSQNVIYIHRSGYENTKSWKVFVESADGQLKHVIAQGANLPPDSVIWDWRIGENRFLAPEPDYRVSLVLDTDASSKTVSADKLISFSARQRVEAIENMLLVEFVFDESEPLSVYLERRLFNFARTFVARAESGFVQSAEIQGHTDNIGSERRNRELSGQRAEREFHIMRKYIAYFAGVPEKQLDKWLVAKNSKLTFKGYGWEVPFILRGKLLGDNADTYGRNFNRRVTLEYRYRMANQ